MTASPVMTVTDELLAELEEAAGNATPGPWNYDGSYVCTMRQEGGAVYVESWNPIADALLSKNVKYIASANPATIAALTAELRRLRAENADLAKDAGRYRWLRDEALNIDGWAPAVVITEGSMIQQFLEGRDLDDEIDTAMAAQ